jgi:hypothetical protein
VAEPQQYPVSTIIGKQNNPIVDGQIDTTCETADLAFLPLVK